MCGTAKPTKAIGPAKAVITPVKTLVINKMIWESTALCIVLNGARWARCKAREEAAPLVCALQQLASLVRNQDGGRHQNDAHKISER